MSQSPPILRLSSTGFEGYGSPEAAVSAVRILDSLEDLAPIGRTVLDVSWTNDSLTLGLGSSALKLTATSVAIEWSLPASPVLSPPEGPEHMILEWAPELRTDFRRGEIASMMKGRTLRRLTISDPDCVYLDLGPRPVFCLMITRSLEQATRQPFLYWQEDDG